MMVLRAAAWAMPVVLMASTLAAVQATPFQAVPMPSEVEARSVLRIQAKPATNDKAEAERKRKQAEEAAKKRQQAEQAQKKARENLKQAQIKAKEREEAARREKEKQEAQRKAKEREEAARKEKDKQEAARKAKEREEAARKEKDKQEEARKAKEREEAARKEKDKQEEARKAKEREELARKEKDKQEEARKAKEREGLARKEKDKQEEARKAKEREELARKEKDKQDANRTSNDKGTCPAGQRRGDGGECYCAGTGRAPSKDGRCEAITQTPATPAACPAGQQRDPKNPNGPCVANLSDCAPVAGTAARRASGRGCEPAPTPAACPTGQQRDPKNPNGPCIATLSECAPGTARRAGSSNCEPLPGPTACPSGQQRDGGGSCVCAATGKAPSRDGRCDAVTVLPAPPVACPAGQARDPKNPTGPCVATLVECAPGTARRRAGGDCEPSPGTAACPSGQQRDYGGYCVCTSSGKLPGRDGRCDTIAQPPVTQPSCPPGQARDPRSPNGPCIATLVECAPGTARRRAGGDCEPTPGTSACPSGQQRDYGGYCVCASSGRPPGRDGRCDAITVVPPPRCPEGTYRDARDPYGPCLGRVVECPAGTYLSLSSGTCEPVRIGQPERPPPEPPRFVPLPVPLPLPGPGVVPPQPPTLIVPPRELAGLCRQEPGTGQDDDVARLNGKEVDITRGALEITYGSRQRKLVRIADLPASIKQRELNGERLHADAYAEVAARASTCKGRTEDGHELRLVDVPMQNGGTAPACIVYCRWDTRAPPPPTISEPRRPALETTVATPFVVPQRPAYQTVVATPSTEPPRRAVPTVIAMPVTQPKRPAVATVVAAPHVVPQRRAVPTLVASPASPSGRPAVPTVRASDQTVSSRPAVETVRAGTVTHGRAGSR